MDIINKLKTTIQKYRLLAKGDNVLIAVSGGPDSVCLLYLLNTLKKEFRLKVSCAHLNHMLRGKNSENDLLFVKKLCEKLKIPFYYGRVNPGFWHGGKINSLEQRARKIRQDFLFKTAAKMRTDKIALGHTLDDQAETVLMRLLRGAGLYGLSAISPKRKICGYTVIRPLIETTKKEALGYLRKKRASYCVDKTNLKDVYFRNRIRNRLIPELKRYNNNIVTVLANTAAISGADYDYIRVHAQKYVNMPLKVKQLSKTHPALRRMVLRLVIERKCGNLRRLNFKHIQELEDLIENRKVKSIVDLPQGIRAIKTKNLIRITKKP